MTKPKADTAEARFLSVEEVNRLAAELTAITDKVYAHVRPRDFSAHRAAFSAHISAASGPVAPVATIGG